MVTIQRKDEHLARNTSYKNIKYAQYKCTVSSLASGYNSCWKQLILLS